RHQSLDGPEIDWRLVNVDLPAITPLAYEGIERSVDAFQPPRSSLGSNCASNLINPNPHKIIRCLSADKERVLRQIVKDNACIEPGQAVIRVEVRDTRRKRALVLGRVRIFRTVNVPQRHLNSPC